MMGCSRLVLLAAFCQRLQCATAVKEVTLTVETMYKAVDCVDRQVIVVNGQLPAPAIEVAPGEELVVTVMNRLRSDSVSIHWHGMLFLDGSPWQDGSGMVSACPTPPMSKFTYRFKANRFPGLYQYHGHVGGLRIAGLGGNFIITGNVSPYFAEATGGTHYYHLQDWYHATEAQIVTGLLEPNFRWPGDPQSLLINGKAVFNCTDNSVYACSGNTCLEGSSLAAVEFAVQNNTVDSTKVVCGAQKRPWYRGSTYPEQCSMSACPDYETLSVTRGNVYLLRFTNGASISLFNVAIQNHTMTVVEVDGKPTKKYTTSSIDLNSGQRVSVLVEMNQAPDVYILKVSSRARSAVRNNYVKIVYNGASTTASSVNPKAVQVSQPTWDDNIFTFEFQNAIKGLYTDGSGLGAVPSDAQVIRTFHMLNTQERMDKDATFNANPSVDDFTISLGTGASRPQGFCDSASNTKPLRWLMGRRYYMVPQTPALSKIYFNIKPETMSEAGGYYQVNLGGVYDMVIQNYPTCGGVCETHAWHIHGMDFWVLGAGRGQWTGSTEQMAALNKVDPPVRDTTQTISEGVLNKPWATSDLYAGCGWTYIRFVVATPGAWFFHCHQIYHSIMGTGAILYTNKSTLPAPPSNLGLCGDMTVAAVAAELMPASSGTTATTTTLASNATDLTTTTLASNATNVTTTTLDTRSVSGTMRMTVEVGILGAVAVLAVSA